MAETKSKSRRAKMNHDDPGVVVFQGEKPVSKAGSVELHWFGDETPTLFGRSIDEVQKDFEKVSGQVRQILKNAFAEVPEGMRFESVEIGLGFSAQGKLAFIAEAGAKVSVTVTFKRQ
jgi:hypothetical protein